MKLVDARQAAQTLGISVNTLYAYVSRGLLQSYEGPDRTRRYRTEDLERLRLRKSRPEEAARSALDWGVPVVESALTQIQESKLSYRGVDACQLAEEASLEEVAGLLWSGDRRLLPEVPATPEWPPCPLPSPFLKGAFQWLAECQENDLASWDLRPEAVIGRGWGILLGLLNLMLGVHQSGGVRQQLQRWPSPRLVESALILCADHELNSSAFAGRVVASSGASPYAVVIGALAALSGPRHGGACCQVEALFDEAAQRGVAATLAARLRRGEVIPGFGHRLYPLGDPRATFILARLNPEVEEWVESGQRLLGLKPSLDMALVALARQLQLPPGSAFQIFATGRCLGWIAHALEQYLDGRLLRPRAHYVGPGSSGS